MPAIPPDVKPKLMRVKSLPSGNKFLPVPLVIGKPVQVYQEEGQFCIVKRGKDVSRFHNSYFEEV